MAGALSGPRLARLSAWLGALLLASLLAAAAWGQTVPALTGRIVDQADLLPADREAALTARLEALERATSRQLVVVTVPDLQGYTVEDFGFRLGETWKIGDKEADNGAILLVSLAERKMRIEVGDGLEPILTDAMSGLIIRDTIRPHFKANDYPAGIEAGVGAIIEQLQAPPEVAEQRALEVQRQQMQSRARSGGGRQGGSILPLIFWGFVLLFVILPMLRGGGRRRGRRYRRGGGVFIWGPGFGGGGGSSWGGGGGGGWGGGGFGGGGGFSGGGGSFGGGGASGGW